MSRDLKPRRNRPSGNRMKSGGGTLIGLFLGLVNGVVAAAGVVWYINKTPTPFSETSDDDLYFDSAPIPGVDLTQTSDRPDQAVESSTEPGRAHWAD